MYHDSVELGYAAEIFIYSVAFLVSVLAMVLLQVAASAGLTPVLLAGVLGNIVALAAFAFVLLLVAAVLDAVDSRKQEKGHGIVMLPWWWGQLGWMAPMRERLQVAAFGRHMPQMG